MQVCLQNWRLPNDVDAREGGSFSPILSSSFGNTAITSKKQKGGRFPDLEQDPGRRAADKGDHNHPFHINKRPNIICRTAPRFPFFLQYFNQR